MNTENRCPVCNAELAANAPRGLCPACLLKGGLASQTGGTLSSESSQAADFTPPTPEEIAAYFPDLEILELVGRGGMGVVYKARQKRLDRLVALKILSPRFSQDAAFAQRFAREARAMAMLSHPHVVAVYDFGESDGLYYFLMEYVDGVNLRRLLDTGKLAPEEALAIVPQICEALQYAHDHGVVHRDIKPENVLLDKEGRVKIADFGIAKLVGAGNSEPGAGDSGASGDAIPESTVPSPEPLTAAGQIVGTPQYMAPEQIDNPLAVDHRADIYSLGVVFYQMLTGELPQGQFAPPSKKVEIDVRLDEVVLRAMEKEPQRRYQQASEVKTQVENIARTTRASDESATPSSTQNSLPKTSMCYVSTPEHLRSFRGRFLWIYKGKGELRLDSESLSFHSDWPTVVIPLSSIRKIAQGDYPISAKPLPLHFIEVTFTENDVERTLLFTPVLREVMLPHEANRVVAEWRSALLEAVRSSTRRTLSVEQSQIAQDKFGFAKMILLTTVQLAVICSIIPAILLHQVPSLLSVLLVGLVGMVSIMTMFIVMRWWHRRATIASGNLDSLTFKAGQDNRQRGALIPTVAQQAGIATTADLAIAAVRWTARIFALILFLFTAAMFIGERPEAAPSMPFGKPHAGERMEWIGLSLITIGYVIGWQWEGLAAVLILVGALEFHIVEWRLFMGPLDLPIIAALLYGLCWWLEKRYPPTGPAMLRGNFRGPLVHASDGQRTIAWPSVVWTVVIILGVCVAAQLPAAVSLGGKYHLGVFLTLLLVGLILLVAYIYRGLNMPPDRLIPPDECSLATNADAVKSKSADQDYTEQARREVYGPAVGLIVTGLVNWLTIFFVLPWFNFPMRSDLLPRMPLPIFLLVAVILALGSALILTGALKMQRLESLAWARIAGVLAMLIGPGYIVGWPVGIWALVVLSRQNVRVAFASKRRTDNSASGSRPIDSDMPSLSTGETGGTPGHFSTSKRPWWRPKSREIFAHMTAAERSAAMKYGLWFGIWNAATLFSPMVIVFFTPIPVPLNWIIAATVLMIGLAFYPLLWKQQARFLCSTKWARDRNIDPASLSMFLYGHTGLILLGAVLLLITGVLWWGIYQPAGVWYPGLVEASINKQAGDITVRVTKVSRHGRVVLVRIACERISDSDELFASLSGPAVEVPDNIVAEMKSVDCLLAPGKGGLGKVLVGTNKLKGNPIIKIGYVLPDEQAAARAVELVRKFYLDQSRGLTEQDSIMPLFALCRRLGKDASGKPVVESIHGNIGWRVKLLPETMPTKKNEKSQQTSPSTQAESIDTPMWARRLAGLKDGDWRTAFGVGQQLAALPPDNGFAILKENWAKIDSVDARQQMLKAWQFAGNNARLLDVLDLGMNDSSPQVQNWAQNYLRGLAFQDFAEDFQAYKPWYESARGKPLAEAISQSVRRFVADTNKAEGKDAFKRAEFLTRDCRSTFEKMPAARKAAIDAGLVKIIERWIAAGSERKASRDNIKLAAKGLRVLALLQVDKDDLKRVMVPLLENAAPGEMQAAAAESFRRKECSWALDVLLDTLKRSLDKNNPSHRGAIWSVSTTLGEIGDPKAIPTMIAVIDADNTYDTIYGVGYFGLGKLTGVNYDEAHDGAWWCEWWEKNKNRYPPAVRTMEITKLPKRTKPTDHNGKPNDPLADVKDVPAMEIRAGGDARKRYFLIGRYGAHTPPDGFGLLIVLPGGDGGADFQPFVRRIHKNVLDESWLIAEAVAPKWDKDQFDRLVWPTRQSPYPAAKFTTEEFIEAIIADVRKQSETIKLNPKRIFVLGWSSGGPPCYALMLRKHSPVVGAFIAMSVFRPEQMPSLESTRGKAFYLLQSPDDRMAPIQFAESAEKALRGAGATVQLQHYKGGHGWHGNVWKMIGDGIQWLDKQADSMDTNSSEK